MNDNEMMAGAMKSVSTASIIYGVIMIIIALFLFTNPENAMTILVKLFGVYAIVYGAIEFFSMFSSRNPSKGFSFFVAIINILVGIFVLSHVFFATAVTTLFVGYMIAFALIIAGIAYFKEHPFLGILKILIGIFIIFAFTVQTVTLIIWIIALLTLFAGIVAIVFGASANLDSKEAKEADKIEQA